MISYGLKIERFAIGGYGVHLSLKRFHQNILKTGAPVSHIILLRAFADEGVVYFQQQQQR
jgi:hypothetical protein